MVLHSFPCFECISGHFPEAVLLGIEEGTKTGGTVPTVGEEEAVTELETPTRRACLVWLRACQRSRYWRGGTCDLGLCDSECGGR